MQIIENNNFVFKQDEVKKINELSPKQIEEYAATKAQELFEKIEKIAEKIKNTEKLIKESKNISADLIAHIPVLGNFIGKSKTEKITQLHTKALQNQNEAVAQLSDMVKEAVLFSTCSFLVAQKMIQIISFTLVNGFENSNGKITELSEEAKKHAIYIMQQAEAFLKQQEQIMQKDKSQDELLEQNTKQIADLEKQFEDQEQKDKRQDEKIEHSFELIQKTQEELKVKKELDENQDKYLQKLEQKLINLELKMNKLTSKNTNFIFFILNFIFSLLIFLFFCFKLDLINF